MGPGTAGGAVEVVLCATLPARAAGDVRREASNVRDMVKRRRWCCVGSNLEEFRVGR